MLKHLSMNPSQGLCDCLKGWVELWNQAGKEGGAVFLPYESHA